MSLNANKPRRMRAPFWPNKTNQARLREGLLARERLNKKGESGPGAGSRRNYHFQVATSATNQTAIWADLARGDVRALSAKRQGSGDNKFNCPPALTGVGRKVGRSSAKPEPASVWGGAK